MWNTDRKATFLKIIGAFEVAAALLEPVVQAADPELFEPDSELPADLEPVAPDFAGDVVDPEPISSDTLWPDDYDEAQVLHIMRTRSGFESEFITDTQMLELLGFEDYQDADLQNWMMNKLGVLVAKGDVTVGEFVLALQYVLENLKSRQRKLGRCKRRHSNSMRCTDYRHLMIKGGCSLSIWCITIHNRTLSLSMQLATTQ